MLQHLRMLFFLLGAPLLCSCTATRNGAVPLHLRCVPSAHRGEHSAAPDNSYSAIRSAVEHSIPYIELDVRATADGKLVLFHDNRLSPDNSVAPKELYGTTISSLTGNEIVQIKNPDGSPILQLADALKIVSGSQSTLQLDVKPDSSDVLLKVLDVLKTTPEASGNLVIQCQHITCIQYLTQVAPSLRLLARVFSVEQFNKVLHSSPYFIQVDEDFLTQEMIEAAHAKKSKVLVKTLGAPPDSFEHWYRLCLLGVDTILTDYPLKFQESIDVSGRN